MYHFTVRAERPAIPSEHGDLDKHAIAIFFSVHTEWDRDLEVNELLLRDNYERVVGVPSKRPAIRIFRNYA